MIINIFQQRANCLVYSLMQYQYHNAMNCSALSKLKFDELLLVEQPKNMHSDSNLVTR